MISSSEGLFLSHFRLDQSDAIPLVKHFSGMSIARIRVEVSIHSERAYPPAVSRQISSSEDHDRWRSEIVSLAEEFGFPHRTATKSVSYSAFDANLGNLLNSSLRLTPSEAGVEEVWNFLTLVLVPDVAAWRYPNNSGNPLYDRWLGRPRNVLRKAWWRSYCLGPNLNLEIGEDEGVAVMERPTFGRNPVLAQMIVSEHLQRKGSANYSDTDLLRKVMVRLGAFASIVNLDCLPEPDLRKLVSEVYSEIIAKVARPEVSPQSL
ncbi:hypothetical protein [Corynebacterium sanguinis]